MFDLAYLNLVTNDIYLYWFSFDHLKTIEINAFKTFAKLSSFVQQFKKLKK